MELKIDPEFVDKIPPLQPKNFSSLKVIFSLTDW